MGAMLSYVMSQAQVGDARLGYGLAGPSLPLLVWVAQGALQPCSLLAGYTPSTLLVHPVHLCRTRCPPKPPALSLTWTLTTPAAPLPPPPNQQQALQRIAEDIRGIPIDLALYVDRLDLYRVDALDKRVGQRVDH